MATKSKKLTRKIYLVCSIDETSYLEFSKQLARLERQSAEPVEVEMSSPGGVAYDALAFAARIRGAKCPVYVRAYGLVASAAVLVLAAGHKRYITKEAWVMVHEDSGKVKGELKSMELETAQLRRMEHQWNALLEELTGTKRSVWAGLHGQTTYLTAEQCLELGLVDEVV